MEIAWTPQQFNARTPSRVAIQLRKSSRAGDLIISRFCLADGNSLFLRDSKFFFEDLQPLNQRRQPFLRALVIEAAQPLVRFALVSLAVRKLVRGETSVEGGRSGQGRCLRVMFRSAQVVFVFLLV